MDEAYVFADDVDDLVLSGNIASLPRHCLFSMIGLEWKRLERKHCLPPSLLIVTEVRLNPRVFQMNSVIHHQAVWPVVCEGKGIFAHLLYSH